MTISHDSNETFETPTLRAAARRRRQATGLRVALTAVGVGLGACSPPPPARAPEPEAPKEPVRSAWPEAPKPESIVQAEFQTSAQAVKPKGKFLLAVRFQIASGYRISWQNPGDVGKSTRVHFEVPEGFTVGELQFPAPERFELPGKLVNYGYENQTAIFAEVTAPDKLPDGRTYRFDVKADWLACMDECASEELSAWFELASSWHAPEPELPADLAQAYASIPHAFSELPDSGVDWKGGMAHPALTLKAPEVKWVDFFPGDGEQPKLLRVKPAGEALELKFARATTEKPLRGLAIGEVEGKTAFYDVNVPWPTE